MDRHHHAGVRNPDAAGFNHTKEGRNQILKNGKVFAFPVTGCFPVPVMS
jgi:hypothetical protein